jgi:hypothetical protein
VNESYLLTIDTTGAVTVSLRHCTGIATCTYLVGRTGLVGNGVTTVNLLPATTVYTGYDVWVNGKLVTALALH